LTRTALAGELGMPKATVTGLVDSLIARGLVSEQPAASSRGRAGRPAKVLSATGPSPTVGVVVLSGGQMVAGVVTYSGRVLGRASAPFANTDADSGAVKLGAQLLNEVFAGAEDDRAAAAQAPTTAHSRRPASNASSAAALAELGLPTGGPTAIVVGIPAPYLARTGTPGTPGTTGSPGLPGLAEERARLLSEVPAYRHWLDGEVVAELEREFGVPVVIENDANLAAMGEATFGAGQGVDSFLFLKLARGVGAGLVVGGRLHRGVTGFAGELAHVHVRDDGPLCPCGGRGCLGGILGDALVQSVQPAYEEPLTFSDVLHLAAGGDPGPRRVLGDLGRTLGRPLADFATLVNPGAIIVDGSFAPAVDTVVAGIRESIDRFAAPVAAAALTVTAGALGEDAELLGGAVLARAKQSDAPAKKHRS
jgi:predicted NBD/HSP70 family sugar kinase